MNNFIFHGTCLLVSTTGVLASPPQVADSVHRYRIIDLGQRMAARGINDRPQVVGTDENGRGFLWEQGVISRFDGLPGDDGIVIGGMNELGDVVGTSWNYRNEVFEGFLRSGRQVIGLGTLPRHTFSEAHAVNDKGHVVGAASFFNGDYLVRRAFLWKDNEMIDLGVLPGGEASSALAINNAGQIVGYAVTADDEVHPVLWQAGSMIDLVKITGPGRAVAINEKGTLVGSGTGGGFLRSTNETIRLGLSLYPRDINDSGQVVGIIGSSVFLWQDGVTHDLNELLSEATEFVLLDARRINNAGQIVCLALHPQTLLHAVLLTPAHLGDLDEDGLTVAPATRAEVSGDRQGELPTSSCSGDSTFDGHVGAVDLRELLNRWGRLPTTTIAPYGNVDASGLAATTGSSHETRAFYRDAALIIPMDGTEDLTVVGNDLYINDGAGGSFLGIEAGAGAIVTVSGAEKGGMNLSTKSFAFSSTAVAGVDHFGPTMNDFIAFLDGVLGLDSTVISGQDLGGGITLNASGQIVITGNEGTVQELDINTADLAVTNGGSGLTQPFVMTTTGQATGESFRTAFHLYDSFCVPVSVSLTLVLQQASGFGSTAIWLAESNDVDALDRIVGLGVLEFDARGMLTDATDDLISVDRDNGAVSPFLAILGFLSPIGGVTAVSNSPSQLFVLPNPYRGFEVDLNGDGVVNVLDLILLLLNWG